MVGVASSGPIGWLFVTCPLLLWWNRDVIRSLRHGDPLQIALRRHYFSMHPSGTFDNDDALAYFKCTLTLITEETTAVFSENGIQAEELQQIQQNITLTTKLSNRGTMNVLARCCRRGECHQRRQQEVSGHSTRPGASEGDDVADPPDEWTDPS